MDYKKINVETIDRWVEEGWEWGIPISHKEYVDALDDKWGVKLTPTKIVPRQWFENLKGKKVLGLASGGGQQMPIFAALGAICTVLDYSNRQIQSEKAVAAREGYDITLIRADMTKKLPFEEGYFDLIFHPVSNSYVEEVIPIWKECFRILKKNGVLMAGLDIGINYIFDDREKVVINALPFNPLKNSEHLRQLEETDSGIQFSHTLEEQVGGQLEVGFLLTHLYEDTNGSGNLHEHNIPSFVATRAIKG